MCCNVLVKTFSAAEGATCVSFRPALESSASCPDIAYCDTSGGRFSSDFSVYDPAADISCKKIDVNKVSFP